MQYGYDDFLVDRHAMSYRKFIELKLNVKAITLESDLEGLDYYFEFSLHFYLEDLGTNFMDLKSNYG